MAFVDERGRLLGRFNLVDAAVVLLVVVLVPLGYAAHRVFRDPPPEILDVTPRTLASDAPRRVRLTGRNFRPFLSAFVSKTGEPFSILSGQPLEVPQVSFLIETPTLVELALPPVGPGTYDIHLYDEAREVAYRQAAITIVAPPRAIVDAQVRIKGAFRGLTQASAGQIAAGAKVPRGAPSPWGEILSVKPPAPDETRLEVPSSLMARTPDRWQVRAELRVRCAVVDAKCYLPGGGVLESGNTLSLDAVGTPMPFTIAEVLPDETHTTMASVTVRFVGRPDILAMAREQDADLSPGGDRDDPAKIVTIRRRSETTNDLTESMADGNNARVLEKVGILEAVLRMPVSRVETGWWYRSQSIKAGASLTFQTDQYVVRGVIESITPSAR